MRKKEKKELDPSGGGWLTGDLPLRGTVDSASPLSCLVESGETCPCRGVWTQRALSVS